MLASRYRQQQAKPILERLHSWLDHSLPKVLPGSAAGKALNYLHNEWDKLTCYMDDGRLEIDNNLAENAIRPFVVERKGNPFGISEQDNFQQYGRIVSGPPAIIIPIAGVHFCWQCRRFLR